MRFTKIRYNGTEVELAWTSKHAGAEEAHQFTSEDAPAPEFTKALEAFKPLVLGLLELPTEYEQDLAVTTLAISESKDQRGLVISATKKVGGANGPFNISTPHLKSKKEEGQPDGTGLISDDMQAALADAERAAEAYYRGKRAQTELGLNEPPVRPTEEGIESIKRAAKREPAGV